MSAPLPTITEAQRMIHDPELCHSIIKVMAAQALIEACEHDRNVTIHDMLRCLDYGGSIAETGARCLYVRTGRDGHGWNPGAPKGKTYVTARADWEAYLHEH